MSIVHSLSTLIPTHSYQTLRRLYSRFVFTLSQQLTTMADTTEIAPNDTIPALPPLPGVAPLLHAPHAGDGQIWPLASAGIAVAVAATPQPR
jgi:hypothetical protein